MFQGAHGSPRPGWPMWSACPSGHSTRGTLLLRPAWAGKDGAEAVVNLQMPTRMALRPRADFQGCCCLLLLFANLVQALLFISRCLLEPFNCALWLHNFHTSLGHGKGTDVIFCCVSPKLRGKVPLPAPNQHFCLHIALFGPRLVLGPCTGSLRKGGAVPEAAPPAGAGPMPSSRCSGPAWQGCPLPPCR